jgi:hypothetical protein
MRILVSACQTHLHDFSLFINATSLKSRVKVFFVIPQHNQFTAGLSHFDPAGTLSAPCTSLCPKAVMHMNCDGLAKEVQGAGSARQPTKPKRDNPAFW